MAMPQISPGEWTVADILALPEDGKRHELVGGVHYVTPTPRLAHQAAVEKLGDLLKPYVIRHQLGEFFRVPGDIQLGDDLVEPDLFVIPTPRGRMPLSWSEVRHLVLAVEVLSPSTARLDRGDKRRLYQRHADEYWIVDLDARVIERWRPGDERPEVLDAALTWQPAGAGEPLHIELPGLFSEVTREPSQPPRDTTETE